METPYQPILSLSRGTTVESIHYGAVAVVDIDGTLIASYGDPHGVAFLRSTAKPFQALPFIEAGGHEKFGMTPQEVAMICASHSGTDQHLEVVQGLQAKIGIQETDLMCGTHLPTHLPTAHALIARGEAPPTNRHNCSGKHTGMLAHARLRDLPLDGYLNYEHQVQQRILQTFAEMCEQTPDDIQLGIDGCSAPNFATSFYHAAWAWARLADPSKLSAARAAACRTIHTSMMAHSDMVAGPDRFDTDLMEASGGRIVSKGGAEGYQGIGLLRGALGPDSPALGIAIKISDGDLRARAIPAVAIEVLRQLGALDKDTLQALSAFGPVKPIQNWRKLVVGEQRPLFKLQRN